jgi:hypothetical protein
LEKNLAKLPEVCYNLDRNGKVVKIIKGSCKTTLMLEGFDYEAANHALGVKQHEAEAMLVGVHFGWDVMGADPDTYSIESNPYKLRYILNFGLA